MERRGAVWVAAFVGGVTLALSAAAYRARLASLSPAETWPPGSLQERVTPDPLSAALEEARLLDRVAVQQDSLLGLSRFAVLAIGVEPQAFEVRAFGGRAPRGAIGRDTILVRAIQLGASSAADTLLGTAGQPVRVQTPALLLLDRRVGRFTVSTDHPTQAIELRGTWPPPSSRSPALAGWGPLQGWQIILRRTGALGQFVPVAEPRPLRRAPELARH